MEEFSSRGTLWRRWVVVVTVGEFTGFLAPALAGVWILDGADGRKLLALTAAGFVEGAVLGWSQAIVLRRVLPSLRMAPWIVATSVGAAVAWLIGMLPSTTHNMWSTWPAAVLVVGAAVLGILLVCAIGTAQVLVMPAAVKPAHRWIGWTALGWCGGLVTFGLVVTPLWHEGQPRWQTLIVGLAGALLMAALMAAITGVGVVGLSSRAAGTGMQSVLTGGRMGISSLLGAGVYDTAGRRLGAISDVVADLAVDLDRVPVTKAIIGRGHGIRLTPWDALKARRNADGFELADVPELVGEITLGAGEVLVRRDVLDCPVIVTDPPRRARVSDVVLEVNANGAWVTGLDITTASALRRLIPKQSARMMAEPVRLSGVHLAAGRAHTAQLAVPESMVFRLDPAGMAEVLTRASVTHARDIARTADQNVLDQAVALLHPSVRARVTGVDPPPRRALRLRGWRLLRPRGHEAPGRTGEK